MKRDLRVVIKLNMRHVCDMIRCADIGYWAECDGISVRVRIADDPAYAGKKYALTDARIRRGMQLMADKYPRHFASYLADSDDAETGDMLVQLVCFGEVIFG